MTDDKKNNPQVNDAYLERLLDEGLKQYGVAEPRPGLETRILANVEAAEKHVPRFAWWRWVAGAAALAAAVIIFTVMTKREPANPAPHSPLVKNTMPAPAPSTSLIKSSSRPTPRNVNTSTQAAVLTMRVRETVMKLQDPPRMAMLPAQTPLSEQEQLLLLYLRNAGREEIVSHARPDPPPANPVVLKPDQIPPPVVDSLTAAEQNGSPQK